MLSRGVKNYKLDELMSMVKYSGKKNRTEAKRNKLLAHGQKRIKTEPKARSKEHDLEEATWMYMA